MTKSTKPKKAREFWIVTGSYWPILNMSELGAKRDFRHLRKQGLEPEIIKVKEVLPKRKK